MPLSNLRCGPLHRAISMLMLAVAVPTAATELPLTSCYLDGFAQAAQCGQLTVWEHREAQSGHRIDLAVTVIPARSARPEPDPLVLLAGGPGQGARDLAAMVEPVFGAVRRSREIVLVDLRGTGDSAPLDCPDLPAAVGSTDAQVLRTAVATCAARYRDRDLTQYGHDPSLQDLAQVLEALGYGRVNLWGGSFGTRAALLFAARYPERVRSLVLDAPAPPDLRFPLFAAQDAEAALDRLLQTCEEEAACRAQFPNLRSRLEGLVQRLDQRAATHALVDPVTGTRRTVRISRDDFAATLRGGLYVPSHTAVLPYLVERADRDDFAPFVALAGETAAWSVKTMSLGATLALVCSEEMSRIGDPEIDPATTDTVVGRGFVDAWRAMCSVWPVGAPPPELSTLAAGSPLAMPALIVTGEWDPITPPRWGEKTAALFHQARLLTLPGGGHTVSGAGCLPRLLADFVSTLDLDALDDTCVQQWQRPPIVLHPSGIAPVTGETR